MSSPYYKYLITGTDNITYVRALFTHEVLQLLQLGLFVRGDVEALGWRGRRQRELRRHGRVRPRVHPHRALPEFWNHEVSE